MDTLLPNERVQRAARNDAAQLAEPRDEAVAQTHGRKDAARLGERRVLAQHDRRRVDAVREAQAVAAVHAAVAGETAANWLHE